ncbi:MAG: glycosyltransferase family protein [Sphingomonadaceae bacterium]|nr:glycosyltransferase family protein [Sphingomonadaceae bacterium]
MSRTVALIQARMSSSRFPGKVIADLGGRPMISFMVDRVRAARRLDDVVVVTSTDASDDALVEALAATDTRVLRGNLHDVLDRYAEAAQAMEADVVVRLTGDCPLADPAVVDAVVELRETSGADYCSNVAPPTFADGLDVECFTRAVLDRARHEAGLPAEREHVTPWMRSPAAELRLANLVGLVDTSHLRLTVDYPDDLEMVRAVVARLGTDRPTFDQFDILRCLTAEPGLLGLNRHARNEGMLKPQPSGDDGAGQNRS